MSTALQVVNGNGGELATASRKDALQHLLDNIGLVMDVMKKVMKEGEHYGKIPGCGDKPTLLKSGAEKLMMTFRFTPTYDIKRTDHPNGHREYEVVCTLNNGTQGVGSCSTMESKYRYRSGPKKCTDRPVPKEYWNLRGTEKEKAQQLIGGKGFSVAKNDAGQWMICEQGERVEHDNPADFYNTALKIAKKRALVDATITATGCSDIFTQDIEDAVEDAAEPEKPQEQHAAPPPAPPPPAEDDAAWGSAIAQANAEVDAAVSRYADECPIPPPGNAPQPTPDPEPPADGNRAKGVVKAVTSKANTDKRGKPYTIHSICIGDSWFTTFDSRLADIATKNKGSEVVFVWRPSAKGFKNADLLSIQ